jgi:hypothetical protein
LGSNRDHGGVALSSAWESQDFPEEVVLSLRLENKKGRWSKKGAACVNANNLKRVRHT